MILVTVGSHTQGFRRLVEEMDKIAPELGEPVLMQTGFTRYTPRNTKYFKFVDEASMDKLLSEASIVVAHGGAASLMKALFLGKPTVAVPRLRKFREHIDDHQLELAQALAEKGKVIVVEDIADLKNAVEKARRLTPSPVTPKKELAKLLKNHIERLGRAENSDK